MKKLFGFAILLFSLIGVSLAQGTSANGGSIEGTITDPTGAVVSGASVVVKSTETGFTKSTETDGLGGYRVGPLNPGPYTITVTSTGFLKLDVSTVVKTGTVTNASYKLTLGSSSETVQVDAGALQVNTDQPGVADVIGKQQIDSLPINGRNFLDVAQLQPGVILQSGETFDPTKAGYSAISVGGVSGRTTRILLDGQDITDETVGTSIMNVTTGAIDEFQLNRANQDVSGEVTSTGQVLVSSRTGTNAFHGNAFYNFQDHRVGFARTTGGFDAPFQRNQFGGAVGGPIIQNKLFFFADVERIKQDAQASATTSPTFAAIQTQYPFIPAPFRDTFSLARVDWNAPKGMHVFARIAYGVTSDDSNYADLYSLYNSRNNVPAYVGGVDFTTGRFTHSFRGGYEKFHNLLSDGTAGVTSIYNPSTAIGVPVTLLDGQDGFYAGPNYLAPQGTYQSGKQIRYDGTWTKGQHSVRFGASMNRLLGGGFAEFYGQSLYTVFGAANLVSGGNPADPINGYAAEYYILGNGNGFFSEKPGFGLKGGGLEDWRSAWYVGDTWKVSQSLTASFGLRWSVDTDRANQDLPTPSCASVAPSLQFPGCTSTSNTNLFDQFQQGLGKPTKQPYANFAPQVGFVFSPGAHKFAFRGGAGIFYDSDIFNNTSNARSQAVNANGNYFNYAGLCGQFHARVIMPDGSVVTSINGVSLSTVCAEPIAQAAPQVAAVKAAYQAASQTGGPNPSYIGSTGGGLNSLGMYAAPYQTPYAIQFNGGVQRELPKGIVLSVDFIHSATLKIPIQIDVNHVGAARFLNKAGAQAAIAATLAACGAASINAAIVPGGCPGGSGVDANGNPNASATIVDFASNGLDSGNQFDGSFPASSAHTAVSAFPGANPNVGRGFFILPVGRSGYDALQIVFKQQAKHPVPGVMSSNVQVSYSLSRIINPIQPGSNSAGSGDQFFSSYAWNNDNPNLFMGRSNLDHTNQLSFGGSMQLKYGLNASLVGHFYSAGATSLTLDSTSGAAGEIFRTDVDGDGTTGDLVPGTNPGAYMHEVKGAGLNKLINNYNATQAGTLTPAGKALVAAGLFTQSQLVSMNAVQQAIATAPTTPINNGVFRGFDASFTYPIKLSRVREGLSLEPGVALYNVSNMSNFGRLGGVLANTSTAGGSVGAVSNFLNGPNDTSIHDGIRWQRGSGTFDQGAPRSTEFQLKVNF